MVLNAQHVGRWETEVQYVYGSDNSTTERWNIIMETVSHSFY